MKEKKELENRVDMLEKMISEEEYIPLKFKELVNILQVPKEKRQELREALDQLISQGKIIVDSRNRYRLPDCDLKVGTFSATQRGYGFVIVEGEEEDIFIPEKATMSAMHGDKVMFILSDKQSGKRQEGAITKVLERATI